MPEGPEVEVVKETLQPLIDKKIEVIKLTESSQKYNKYKGKQEEFQYFQGSVIQSIQRKGKYLIWQFDKKKVILNHLGMTGMWYLTKDKEESRIATHPKLILKVNTGIVAVFNDIRNFGQLRIFDSYAKLKEYPPIKKLGIDGLLKPFPIENFIDRLSAKKYLTKQIGEVLLDQNLVAGIGNIYKSESLFIAELDPRRLVKDITIEEKKTLAKAISKTLHKALQSGGSSIQTYRTPTGEVGRGQHWHKVYRKEFCTICNSKIQKIIQNKRTTYFCPLCQN